MTLHVSALMEQHERYQAVRARLWFSKSPKAETVEAGEPKPIVKVIYARRPAWKVQETNFDLHVRQYHDRLLSLKCNKPLIYLKDRCNEIGISYAEIIGPKRTHEFTGPRHLLMWELYTKFGLSFPALGRMFGGRDHTSCLFAVRKIEAKKGSAA